MDKSFRDGQDDVQSIAVGSSPNNDPDGDGLEDRTVGTVMQQAGTLMHELGHNLSLCHGGSLDHPTYTQCNMNFKPNYLSIMNYRFQMSGILPGGRLDYSAEALPDLDEDNHLDETVGIQDGLDDTIYNCPGAASEWINWRQVPGNGPIDWNCNGDGAVESDVRVNINADFDDRGDPIFSILEGFNDWENLKFDFQNTEGFADGVHEFIPQIQHDEIDFLTAKKHTLSDLIVSAVGPTEAKPGEEIPVKLPVKNIGASAPGTIDETENGYMVDIVLSTDDFAPIKFAKFSPHFFEDVLLKGGRVSRTQTLPPGERIEYAVRVVIPVDAPPGDYHLCAVVDPGTVVQESNENNNVACSRLRLSSPLPVPGDVPDVPPGGGVVKPIQLGPLTYGSNDGVTNGELTASAKESPTVVTENVTTPLSFNPASETKH